MKVRDFFESAVEHVGDKPYKVLVNPAPNTLVRFIGTSANAILKGLYDRDSGKIFVWDALHATHGMAEFDLSIEDPIPFIIGFNEDKSVGFSVIADDWKDAATVANHRLLKTFKADPDEDLMRRWH